MTNPLRLGIFSALQNVEEKRSARADKARQVQMQQGAMRQQAEDRKRKQMLEDLVTDRQMRDAGYVPDAERGPDAQVSGQSLDQIVGLGTGMPVVGMKGTEKRYGSSVGGYTYDRMNPKRQSQLLEERLKEAQAAKYEHDAQAPYREPGAGNIDPLSEQGINAAVRRAQGVANVRPKSANRPRPNEFNNKAAFMLEGAKHASGILDHYSAPAASMIRKVPLLGNYGMTENDQIAQQAAETMYDAYLRLTTGATIAPEELKNAAKQFVPQPGDKPGVLREKALRRRQILDAMKRAAQPALDAADEPTGTDTDGLPYPSYDQ